MTNIKKVRQSKGVSIYYLAKKTGLNYSTLFIIEKGGDLRLSTLYKIAKALAINPSELLLEKKCGNLNEKPMKSKS